jgi:hypothetical protein
MSIAQQGDACEHWGSLRVEIYQGSPGATTATVVTGFTQVLAVVGNIPATAGTVTFDDDNGQIALANLSSSGEYNFIVIGR